MMQLFINKAADLTVFLGINIETVFGLNDKPMINQSPCFVPEYSKRSINLKTLVHFDSL